MPEKKTDEQDTSQSSDERAFQFALTELLIDSGIIGADEFKDSLVKWRKKLGVESLEAPLAFLARKPQPRRGEFPGLPVKKTVLVVDDVQLVREMIKSALAQHGFTVIAEAENGTEALEMFRKKRPSFVLMDIEMKGMSGIEALRSIRKIDAKTPVIIMTGNPQREYVQQALECGMTDFIVKPLDVNRLLAVLGKFTEQCEG